MDMGFADLQRLMASSYRKNTKVVIMKMSIKIIHLLGCFQLKKVTISRNKMPCNLESLFVPISYSHHPKGNHYSDFWQHTSILLFYFWWIVICNICSLVTDYLSNIIIDSYVLFNVPITLSFILLYSIVWYIKVIYSIIDG